MKNIKKLLFTILIVFITIVTVKAEAIKQIDVYLSYLPDANERAEFFYMSTNLLEYNRDKVGMDLELFDGDNYVDWDDELEAGKTYKIMLYFETNSVNDWLDDNTVVKVHALNGTNLPNTTQVFENEWVYTYEFEYTIPTTSMAKNIITFYEDGTSSSTSQLYVNNGVTITVPDRFYSEPEGYVFDGFLYNDHKYNAGDEFTVTEDATFVAQFVPVTTTPKTYKIKYYVDGELKHEVDAPEGTELWEYASPDEVFDNIPAGKSMNYEDTWYRDSEFKELETFINKDHSPILVNKDYNFYAYYGYYYDVEARIINYSSYSYFENLKLTSTEEPNGYPGLYAFVPLSNHTTTLGYIDCDGLEFVGWSTSANQSDIVSTEKTYVFDVDSNGKQMYALFSKKDDAHYVYFEDHEELTQFVSDGNKATAPTGMYQYKKEVEGWYLDSGLTDKFDFDTPITEDKVLYVKWKASDKLIYPVYFYDNKNGTGSVVYVARGEKATRPVDPTLSGKVFSGWYGYLAAASASNYYTKFDFDTPIYVAKDLYSAYSDIYNISFNTNGAGSIESITNAHTNNGVIQLPTPNRTGYTFGGWYLDEGLTKKFTNDYEFEDDITLYAKWTINTYTVEFDSKGGNAIDSVTKEYNAAIGDLPTPTKEGAKFDGWYTDVNYGTKATKDTLVTDNMTLYAKWIANKYTVTFDTQGGNQIDSLTFNHNDIIPNESFPANPTRAGYEFNGWCTDKEGTKEFYETKITSDITLFARWKQAVAEAVTKAEITLEKGVENSATITISNYFANQKYTLEKSTNNKKWSKVKLNNNANTFEVKGITYGQKTYYRVKAVLDGKTAVSNVVNIKVKPATVQNLVVKKAGATNIEIGFDKANYNGYEVQRSTKPTSGFKKVTTLTKNTKVSYNNKKLKNATTYYYRVRAYKTVKGKKVYGDWSNVVSAITGPAKPSKLTLKATDYKTIEVGIKASKTATKYEVQRSTNKKKGFTTIGTTDTLTYTDTVNTGTTYYYKVRACNAENVCSGYSKVFSKKATLSKPGITGVANAELKNAITLTAVDGAEGYEIQRSTKKKKGFKAITTSTELTYEDVQSKAGKTLYYRARAYRMVNGKKVYSGYSKVVSLKTKE